MLSPYVGRCESENNFVHQLGQIQTLIEMRSLQAKPPDVDAYSSMNSETATDPGHGGVRSQPLSPEKTPSSGIMMEIPAYDVEFFGTHEIESPSPSRWRIIQSKCLKAAQWIIKQQDTIYRQLEAHNDDMQLAKEKLAVQRAMIHSQSESLVRFDVPQGALVEVYKIEKLVDSAFSTLQKAKKKLAGLRLLLYKVVNSMKDSKRLKVRSPILHTPL